jgi:dihydrofolate reductase
MGKNTWLSIPEQHRPLKRRLNCVLSHTLVEYDVKDVVFFTSLEKCLESLDRDDTIENIFII